jgi:hypothetical protein
LKAEKVATNLILEKKIMIMMRLNWLPVPFENDDQIMMRLNWLPVPFENDDQIMMRLKMMKMMRTKKNQSPPP